MKLASLLVVVWATSLPAADIDAALGIAKRTENLVYRDRVKPNWLPDGKSFWYRVQTGPQTYEFVLINAETGARKTAKDLKSLEISGAEPVKSSALPLEIRKTSRTGDATALKITNQLDADTDLFWVNQQGERVSYGALRAGQTKEIQTFDGHVWLVTSKSGEPLAVWEASVSALSLIIDGKGVAPAKENGSKPMRKNDSPDGRWTVSIDNGLVKLRDRKSNTTTSLKTTLDGKSPFRGGATWAPDSSAFVVSNAADVPVRKVTIVDSSPKDQLQPKLKVFDYNKPGDPLPKPMPVLFHVGSETGQVIDDALFATPFTESTQLSFNWAPDSTEFYFDYNQRGHQVYRIIGVHAKTGAARAVVEETAKTFIDYTNKTWRHWSWETGSLLWLSERDGWCHLYGYDIKSGNRPRQITRGNWVVRKVLQVDEPTRDIWFLASGLRPDEDPYHEHLCRVKFDGSGFLKLTEGDGQHHVEFSPDRKYFVDRWSRVDLPPVHELRRSSDGKLVCVLEKAVADKLLAAGWTMPERIVAKGRDGRTDIHGILVKPANFDPRKKYPVIEKIYAGPHSAFVPKEFGRLIQDQQFAALGFVVVQIDGQGTNHRGKAFHDVCYKNLKDAGYPDRIAWIKAAAQTRPWLDPSRVGIFGGSAGGQNAMRAVLDFSDFYHVAVADCGCHDNRMDKIWWNEQWLGWPIDKSYAENSNAEDAKKLKGHLLLIVGELDNNVDPASTMQVVGALQKAGKSFEYMPIVGANHGAAETPYGSRLRMEFLLKHLRPGE